MLLGKCHVLAYELSTWVNFLAELSSRMGAQCYHLRSTQSFSQDKASHGRPNRTIDGLGSCDDMQMQSAGADAVSAGRD